MDGLVIVLLAMLAGAVLYLLHSQRNFQRIDYSELVRQEEREKRLVDRLAQLENMLGEAREYAVALSVLAAGQGKANAAPTSVPAAQPQTRAGDSSTRRVAEMLVAGYSAQQVARSLGLSESEVELAAELAAAGRF